MNRNPEMMRVSAAALCWIPIRHGCLLAINPNHENVVAPLGGVLRFGSQAVPALAEMGAVEEAPGNADLRLSLPISRLGQFRSWFATAVDRETSPLRELGEELVTEYGVLSDLNDMDVEEMTRKATVESCGISSRRGFEGIETVFLHEIYLVRFALTISGLLEAAVERQESPLVVVTAQETERKFSSRVRLPISDSALRMFDAMRGMV